MTLAVRVISFLNVYDSFIKILDRNSYDGNIYFFAKISTLISTFEAKNGKKLSTSEAENGKNLSTPRLSLKKGVLIKKNKCMRPICPFSYH